jgi:hypothetical protein
MSPIWSRGMFAQHAVHDAIEKLRCSGEAMSDWERGFLASISQRDTLTPKQRHVLAQLVSRYLHDALLSAEILGQERLFH